MIVQFYRKDRKVVCDEYNVEAYSLLELRYILAFRVPKHGRGFQEVYDDLELVES